MRNFARSFCVSHKSQQAILLLNKAEICLQRHSRNISAMSAKGLCLGPYRHRGRRPNIFKVDDFAAD